MSKFGHFMNNSLMRNIIGQRQSSFSFDDVIEGRKILLVNLSKGKIGEINAHMLGLILISKLQAAILNRAHKPAGERHPFYLYVDEFQNFVTDTFTSILSESRKYGLGAHLTNQYIAQLPEKIKDAVLGNAGTLLSFEVGMDDAELLAKEFDPLKPLDFTGLARFNFYIKLMVQGKTSTAFSGVSIAPDDVSRSETAEKLILDFNRLAYAAPRLLVERVIQNQIN